VSAQPESGGQAGAIPLAKISPPRLRKIVPREGCYRLLKDARGHRIVYLSGGPGYGKTTLALSWLKRMRRKAVWLTLDEGDNEPVELFRLLVEAFRAAFPGSTFSVCSIPAGSTFDLPTFARTFARELLADVPGRSAIVLDDFHHLDENGPGQAVVAGLADALSPHLQLVIVSRRRPPASMATWIVRRDLLHLAEDALRFSADETRSLYKAVLDVPLKDEDVQALHAATDGWVTGLLLLSEHVRLGHRVSALAPDRIGGLGEYLYREVLGRFDPAVQQFMVSTSLLDAFSLQDAERLLGLPGAIIASHLDVLLDHHLVSETPTARGNYFRYAPLLRTFLRAQAATRHPVEREALLERIAEAYERDGRGSDAVDLFLANDLPERAVRLIERWGIGLLVEGRRMRLRQWIRSLPDGDVAARPWLQFFAAADQAFTDARAASGAFGRALEGFERGGDVDGQVWTLAHRIFLEFYAGHDYRRLDRDAERGRRVIRRHGRRCSDRAKASFFLAEGIAAIVAQGRPYAGYTQALRAAELAQREGELPFAVWATAHAAYCAFFCGRFAASTLLFERAQALMPWDTLDPVRRAELLRYRGALESFRGESDKSLASLTEAEHLCLDYGLVSLLPVVRANLWRQCVLRGETLQAGEGLEALRRQAGKTGNRYLASYLSYWEAIDSMRHGALGRALAQAKDAVHLLEECHSPLLVAIPRVLVGVIMREMGDVGLAERVLRRSLARFEKAHSHYFEFWTLMHLAKLAMDRRDEQGVDRWLGRALTVGKTECYLVGDAFTSSMMGALLGCAKHRSLEGAYVDRLIAHWNVVVSRPWTIRTFGTFEVLRNGQSVVDDSWRSYKVRDFLLALITLGGSRVSKDDMMDLLWPDSDGDRAAISFHTTLHRLQNLLGRYDDDQSLLQLKMGCLSLDRDRCWVDCWVFEEAAGRARLAEGAGQSHEARRHLEEARLLYQGDYLPALKHEAWIDAKRQALRQRYAWVEQRLQP